MVASCLPLTVLSLVLLCGRVPYLEDVSTVFYPLMHHYGQGLRQGCVPLWNPHLAGGYDAHAAGQTGMFYPVNLLLFFLWPVPTAFALSYVVHLALATGGMGWFLLRHGLPRSSAVMGGALYGLSGLTAAHHLHLNSLVAMGWLPLVLLGLNAAGKGRWSWRALVLCAAPISMLLLGGHPQWMWMTVLVACVYLLLGMPPLPPRATGVRVAVVGTAAGLGLLLAAVQILPTAEAALKAPRFSGDPYQHVTSLGFELRDLPRLFAPNLYGSPASGSYDGPPPTFWETCAFMGFTAALLAGLRLFRGGFDPLSRFAFVVTCLGACLAPASANPLYHIIAKVPLLQGFRAPGRYLWLVVIGIAILAAEGHAMLRQPVGQAQLRRLQWFIAVISLAAATIIVMGNMTFAGFRWVLSAPLCVHTLMVSPQTLADRIHNYFVSWDPVVSLIAILGVGAMSLRRMTDSATGANTRNWSVVVPALAMLELCTFWHSFVKTAPREYFSTAPSEVAAVRHTPRSGSNRVLVLDPSSTGAIMERRLPLLELLGPAFGLSSTNGLESLQPWDTVTLTHRARACLLESLSRERPPTERSRYSFRGHRLCDVLGVDWIITSKDPGVLGFRRVDGLGLQVAHNPTAVPEAYLSTEVLCERASGEQVMALESSTFLPGKTCVLACSVPPRIGPLLPGDGCQLRWLAPTHFVVRYRAQAKAVLIVNQHWAPGWHARMKRRVLKPEVANGVAMAVTVPPAPQGEVVRFVYAPRVFILGRMISLAALFLLGGGAVLCWSKQRASAPAGREG